MVLETWLHFCCSSDTLPNCLPRPREARSLALSLNTSVTSVDLIAGRLLHAPTTGAATTGASGSFGKSVV